MEVECTVLVEKTGVRLLGYVIGSVPCPVYHREGLESELFKAGFTSKALVVLEEFDAGQVVEVPWTRIRIIKRSLGCVLT